MAAAPPRPGGVVLRASWLERRGRITSKRRYFVLTPCSIVCFTEEGGASEGTVPICPMTQALRGDGARDFVVSGPGCGLWGGSRCELRADSTEGRDGWVRAISEAAGSVRERTAGGVDSRAEAERKLALALRFVAPEKATADHVRLLVDAAVKGGVPYPALYERFHVKYGVAVEEAARRSLEAAADKDAAPTAHAPHAHVDVYVPPEDAPLTVLNQTHCSVAASFSDPPPVSPVPARPAPTRAQTFGGQAELDIASPASRQPSAETLGRKPSEPLTPNDTTGRRRRAPVADCAGSPPRRNTTTRRPRRKTTVVAATVTSPVADESISSTAKHSVPAAAEHTSV
eukprot:TRINITY_DN39889_c0_g1_i1.p1 TRINITY_DN39889_c0_g1~~TRINITY_DN39889_c0_g1_i1.p1  ORF type:complete len:361 (+),score=79.38 TRINITY_DN39889_c0_g1_i1:56-1084(+)